MNDLIPEVRTLYRQRRGQGTVLDLSELVDCIILSSTSFSSTDIILDALDAIEKRQRPQLLDSICQLSDGAIKVLATGRPNLQDLNEFFRSIPNVMEILIRAHIHDLKNYISREASQRNLGEKMKDKLMDKLSIQADGV